MKNLSDTYLFNKTVKNTFLQDVKKINFSEDIVKQSDLEESIKIISRRFKYSLLNTVIDEFYKGRLLCLYTENINFTRLIPIFQVNTSNGIASIVNIKPYSTRDKSNNYNIDNRTLYALLECGLICKELRENESKFLMNQNIVKLSALVYTKLMNKIFDKLYGINLVPERSDQLNFVLAKFFLLYILERENNETTENIAVSCCFNGTQRNIVTSADIEFDDDAYTSLENFFKNIAEHLPTLSKVNLRTFLDNWMIMYGENSVFSIENYPTLLTNCICGAIFTARINRDMVFENVIGREIGNLHTEICRVIK